MLNKWKPPVNNLTWKTEISNYSLHCMEQVLIWKSWKRIGKN